MNDIEILEELRHELGLYANGEKVRQGQAIENLIQRNKDLEEIEKEHKEENGRLRNRIKELEGIYTTAYNMGKAYINIKWKEKIIKKAKEYKETKQKVGEYMAIALEELLEESEK